jgi:hypothetical protein
MNVLQEHNITFDPARHLYFRSGFPLPSVTQILPFNDENIAPAVLRQAAERGRRVHKWIENLSRLYDGHVPTTAELETSVQSAITESDKPYRDAWLDFGIKTGFAPAIVRGSGSDHLLVETFIYHPIYQYVGRLDLIGYLRNIRGIEDDLTLVDAKAVVKVSPTTALQTAAYMQAINPVLKQQGLPEVKHRWAAHLLPTGRCKREAYEDHRGDFATFLNYLGVTRWETKNGMREFLEDPFTAPDKEVDALAARFV